MRIQLISMLVGALALTTAGSCKKKDETAAKTEPAAPAAAKPDPAAPAAPAASAKSVLTPAELWAAQEAMSRMDKMDTVVTVNATVTKINAPEGAEYAVEADAGGGKVLAITFADFGAAAKAKPLKVGDAITVSKCMLTNAEGNRLAIIQCELK